MNLVQGFDHMVLTVADVQAALDFYAGCLGLEAREFASGRWALHFGHCKINLHQAGGEFKPHAAHPAPGSADFCLVCQGEMGALLQRLAAKGLSPELGPVDRLGAKGPMSSVYLRDPDRNLVELAIYPA